MYNKLNAILIFYMVYSSTAAWAGERIGKNPIMQLYPVNSAIFDIHKSGSDNHIYIADRERGPECPTGSGEYCTAESNHCCLINNIWTCVAKLEDCKDD